VTIERFTEALRKEINRSYPSLAGSFADLIGRSLPRSQRADGSQQPAGRRERFERFEPVPSKWNDTLRKRPRCE
jgi:hypothetical protein